MMIQVQYDDILLNSYWNNNIKCGEKAKYSWRLTKEINILSFDIRKIAYFDWENVSFESRCKEKTKQKWYRSTIAPTTITTKNIFTANKKELLRKNYLFLTLSIDRTRKYEY